jgi:hypothetical protein
MNQYHEVEIVELRAAGPQPRAVLHKILKALGYQSIDDFYAIRRSGQVLPWQSIFTMTLDVELAGNAVYETEEDVAEGEASEWDRLVAKYFMAGLPSDFIGPFVQAVTKLSEELNLDLVRDGRKVSPDELQAELVGIAQWLDENYFEAGSKNLGILISEEYPRR